MSKYYLARRSSRAKVEYIHSTLTLSYSATIGVASKVNRVVIIIRHRYRLCMHCVQHWHYSPKKAFNNVYIDMQTTRNIYTRHCTVSVLNYSSIIRYVICDKLIVYSAQDYRLPCLTTVKVPAGVDWKAVVDKLMSQYVVWCYRNWDVIVLFADELRYRADWDRQLARFGALAHSALTGIVCRFLINYSNLFEFDFSSIECIDRVVKALDEALKTKWLCDYISTKIRNWFTRFKK